jgi:predicted O-methyltransferase YrrM
MKVMQHPAELARFIAIARQEGVCSYLEIGSKFGGSLQQMTLAMPVGSRSVSVDLPAPDNKHWPASKVSLTACVDALRLAGYDTHLIWGDSTDPEVVKKVWALGPFDLILIDGGHTIDVVRADWMNYGPLGRIVAFHDIAWARGPHWTGYQIDVPAFWDSIKGYYRHEEIVLDPTGRDNGLGVIWRD